MSGSNSARESYYRNVTTRVPEFEMVDVETPFTIRWLNPPEFTPEELVEFVEINECFDIERDCDGSYVISSGDMTLANSRAEGEVFFRLRLWAEQDGTGEAFVSSGQYILPVRSMRQPDAAWIRNERIAALPRAEQKDLIPHLAPDFVVEVRSKANPSLKRLQAKMTEYLDNGVRLAWLLDPFTRTAYVYRPDQEVQVLESPSSLDASPELPGFVLDLAPIWNAY